jgi:nucleoside-diphosphate-sugar epimerase
MKVFLTGASGFIGSQVTKILLTRNHQVALLAMPGDPMIRLRCLQNRFETIIATLEDTDLLEQFMVSFKPEACIHLAWYAEPGKYLDSEKNIQSLASSLSLFQTLIQGGCRQIVAAGTCFEYDTNYGYLSEDTPAHPLSLYAAAKLSCCLMGRQLADQTGTSFAWGRIFYPYGPQEDQRRLVPAAINALKQGVPFPASLGEQVRDYIHVTDVADAFCTLMEKQASGMFNISTGVPISVRQLLEIVGHIMDRRDLIRLGELSYRDWEPPFICGNNAKMKSLGWNPSFSLTDGLSQTVHSMQDIMD